MHFDKVFVHFFGFSNMWKVDNWIWMKICSNSFDNYFDRLLYLWLYGWLGLVKLSLAALLTFGLTLLTCFVAFIVVIPTEFRWFLMAEKLLKEIQYNSRFARHTRVNDCPGGSSPSQTDYSAIHALTSSCGSYQGSPLGSSRSRLTSPKIHTIVLVDDYSMPLGSHSIKGQSSSIIECHKRDVLASSTL